MSILDETRVVTVKDEDITLKVGDQVLALIYENDKKDQMVDYALIVKGAYLGPSARQISLVSNIVQSPLLLKELRPEIEAYLVKREGYVHLTQILLCTVKTLDQEEFKNNLDGNYHEVAVFENDQWQIKSVVVEDIRFDLLAYSRQFEAGTKWAVSKVYDDKSFDLTERSAHDTKYSFRIKPVFEKGFSPEEGTELVISPKGEFFWGSNREMAAAIAGTRSDPTTKTRTPYQEETRTCQPPHASKLHERLPPERKQKRWSSVWTRSRRIFRAIFVKERPLAK
jgi:hypothetical protein